MSSNAPLLHRFLYISQLSPDAPPEAVSQILRQSRERNRNDAVSGALVFDGERFCQLLEGEPQAIRSLAARILQDRRHGNVQVLVDEASATPRLFAEWHSGYGDPEALDAVQGAGQTVGGEGNHGNYGNGGNDGRDGATAAERRIAAFLRILPDCDMSL